MMQIKVYKRPRPTTPPPLPPNFITDLGSHKSDQNDPKNAEIRRSAEQSHPCIIYIINVEYKIY